MGGESCEIILTGYIAGYISSLYTICKCVHSVPSINVVFMGYSECGVLATGKIYYCVSALPSALR